MMKLKFFGAVMIVLVISACSVFAADKSAKHPPLIGSIAPSVTLSQVKSTGVSPWHSTDSLGRSGIVYLLLLLETHR